MKGQIDKRTGLILAIVVLAVVVVIGMAMWRGSGKNPASDAQKGQAPGPGSETRIVLAAPKQVAAGETVASTLLIEGANDLAGIQVSVAYDPAVLEFKSVSEGDFLKQGTAQTLFLEQTLNTAQPGLIKDIVVARIGSGASGSGVLAHLRFTARAAGAPGLRIQEYLLSDSKAEKMTAVIASE
jgi:hypothetical protein